MFSSVTFYNLDTFSPVFVTSKFMTQANNVPELTLLSVVVTLISADITLDEDRRDSRFKASYLDMFFFSESVYNLSVLNDLLQEAKDALGGLVKIVPPFPTRRSQF